MSDLLSPGCKKKTMKHPASGRVVKGIYCLATTKRSLWRDRNFMCLWMGQSVSEMGSAITNIVLPLLAITTLSSTPGEIGLLRAMASIAVLLASIPSGVYIDRLNKRRLMIICDVVRAGLLVTVPVLALGDQLSLYWLYAVSFLCSVFSVAFGIAYHAYYPVFVSRQDLPEANSKIETTESAARVGGPGVGTFMAGWIGAPLTLLFDVFSYLVSAVLLAFTRAHEPKKTVATRKPGWRTEISQGFKLLYANSVLARTAMTTIGSMFCLAMMNAVFLYYLINELQLSPAMVGVIFFVGEGGGLLAAVFAGSLMRSIGSARIMWWVVFLSPAGCLLFGAKSYPLLLPTLYLCLTSVRFVLFDISQYSYRQCSCPLDSLGKVTASIRTCIGVAAASGAIIGGWLGSVVSVEISLYVATALMCVSSIPVVFSALRTTRNIEDLPVLIVVES